VYKFGSKSLENLISLHRDLQLILTEAIAISPIDFGISDGHRPVEIQQEYFNQGKSKCDGIKIKSKHNYNPSLAADFYPYVQGAASWNNETLSYLAGLITGVAEMLYKQGRITHKVRWGGNWDMDGEMITDQSFDDRPHVELIKPKN
jgi:peptidoglycan L-alanyl-D-glutamate endopeptidase CwlK